MADNVFYTNHQFDSLERQIRNKYSAIVILVDEHTERDCYPILLPYLPLHHVISIPAGEENKTLEICSSIWQRLTQLNADRNALLVNLGGGVIGDMGGFAAACYKRGIAFINLPTTLLAMVDASVGAKTGIDFEGYKNQIGLFAEPQALFVYTGFLKTLPQRELVSGFAEVIKHYLVADKDAFAQIAHLQQNLAPDIWDEMVKRNISIKQRFVALDPHEKNVRKALNFGHTVGHAAESYFLQKAGEKLLHGEAIALGMVAESFISAQLGKLSISELPLITKVILHYFKLPVISAAAMLQILELMQQDKKNIQGKKQFTLLDGIGNFSINNAVEDNLIIEALQYCNMQRI